MGSNDKLCPCDYQVLEALEAHPDGLTCHQLAVVTKLSVRTCRQAVYKLRKAGHRIGADRVFRVRQSRDSTRTEP